MLSVLVVDDDERLYELLRSYFEQNGIGSAHAADGRRALQLLDEGPFDAVLLDIMMPGPDGLSVLRKIREKSRVPVIMLTAKGDETDRVVGLELGADDYLTKPCPSAELIARAGAVLRRVERTRQPPTAVLVCGTWMLDPVNQTCVLEDDTKVVLTPREAHLLAFLMRRSGRVCTTAQIVRHVWGFAGQQARSIVATSVWRLRAKLEDMPQDPRHILTVRNVGYKFEAC